MIKTSPKLKSVFPQNLGDVFRGGNRARFALLQFLFNEAHQSRNSSWFNKVIIHLVPQCLQSSFKAGISGQDENHTIRLRPAHGADHNKSVCRVVEVQVRD